MCKIKLIKQAIKMEVQTEPFQDFRADQKLPAW